MNHQRFDAVTRTVARAPSRRKLLGLLVTSAVATLLPRRSAEAQQLEPTWYCPPGYVLCGGLCTDLSSDRDNCGACFETCESDLVAVDCVSGQCVRAQCDPPFTYCGVVGGCVDLSSDPWNCGSCGIACDSGICDGGYCVPGCPPGLTDCGVAGCVDLSSDLGHCGGCFETCESGLVAVTCDTGQCIRNQCGPDRTYCGVLGGCRDLSSDPASCGDCGNVCPPGTDCWYGTCI